MMPREITPAQRKAVGKYEAANYDKVLIRMHKGEREKIKAAADRAGLSLNAYIMETVRDRMENEGYNEI
jgi:predicted HicB family RNase H-like nuclease